MQPLARAHFALVTEPMRVRPSAPAHEHFDGLFDLALIGIAVLDHGNWNAVRTEDDLGRSWIGEARQGLIDLFRERFKVKIVAIESLDDADRKIPAIEAVPLVEAAAGRGA